VCFSSASRHKVPPERQAGGSGTNLFLRSQQRGRFERRPETSCAIMMKRSSRDRAPILPTLLLVVASALIATASGHGWLQFLRSSASALAGPVHSARAQAASSIGGAWQRYMDLVGVCDENTSLKRELGRLRVDYARLAEENLRLWRLASLAEAPKTDQYRRLAAEVIASDASTWSRTVLLNRGSADSVQRNDVVISSAGLVGRVMELSTHTARVLLMTDARSAVDCLLQRNRARGVVVGATDNTCSMKYLSAAHDVRVGDQVVSSGLGGMYPKGLLVGTVIAASNDASGPFQRVTVLPATDLERLEEALILVRP